MLILIGLMYSQTDFQQNKDWNIVIHCADTYSYMDSQTDFQQNKDWNKVIEIVYKVKIKLPDRFPTKQGLKQAAETGAKSCGRTPRPISNKTRIETFIEAEKQATKNSLPDRFPTKQGLKL